MFSFLSKRVKPLPGSSTPLSNDRLANLPIILAGPILRHVSPTSVSVWFATRQRLSTATLEIYDASNTRRGSSSQLSSTNEVVLGQKLFLYLITCSSFNQPLEKNSLFTYNITFGSAGTLDSLLGGIGKITYAQSPNARPSFVTAPAHYEDVNIVHSSCRKAHAPGQDAMSMLSANLIEPNLSDPTKRPHLLLLTGDQIYADDVADLLLFMLDDASKALLGWVEALPDVTATRNAPAVPGSTPVILYPQTAVEFLSVEDVNDALPEATQPESIRGKVFANLAPGKRQHTIYRPKVKETPDDRTAGLKPTKITSGLTSDKAKSHLMRLGEFYTMYLFAWSDELWGAFTSKEEAWQVLTGQNAPYGTHAVGEYGKFSDEYTQLESFRNDLPSVRRALANTPTYMICDDHEITDDWFLNLRWAQKVLGDNQDDINTTLPVGDVNLMPPRVVGNPLGSRIVANGMAAYVAFQDWGNQPGVYPAAKQTALDNMKDVNTEHLASSSNQAQREAKLQTLQASVLPSIKIYLKDAETSATVEKDTKVLVPKLDFSFRLEFLNNNVAPNSDKDFQIIFLDSRTNRGLADYTQDRAPELIRTDKLDAEFGHLGDGFRMNFIVAPTPVFGKPYVEALQYGEFAMFPSNLLLNPVLSLGKRYGAISTLNTVDKDGDGIPDEKKGEEGFIVNDREAWLFNEKSFSSILRQLCRATSVVILSGDVHYAFSMRARIWDQKDVSYLSAHPLEKRCVVAQLVSSAGKNQAFTTRALHTTSAGFKWHNFAIWSQDSQYDLFTEYSTLVPSKVRPYLPTELEEADRIKTGNIPLVSYGFRAIQDNRPNNQRRIGGLSLSPLANARLKASSQHSNQTHLGLGQTVNVGFNNIGLVRFTSASLVVHDILHRQGTSTRHEIDLTPIGPNEKRPGEAP